MSARIEWAHAPYATDTAELVYPQHFADPDEFVYDPDMTDQYGLAIDSGSSHVTLVYGSPAELLRFAARLHKLATDAAFRDSLPERTS